MASRTKDILRQFLQSERSGGFILIFCASISLIIANTRLSENYLQFWHSHLDLSFWKVELNYSIEHWINDGLMSVFFLLVGLEIKREIEAGELSNIKKALFPVFAAIGGMIIPALIHFSFNSGTKTVSGFGIPMATDIAFALGILSLVGKNVPISLKIFLTAFAIIDDLGAIVVIALYYSTGIELTCLLISLGIFLLLLIANKSGLKSLSLFIAAGAIMWYFMLKSGIHPSIAGVLLAFATPSQKKDSINLSNKVQHSLHYPVAFIVLPLFALANTAILIPKNLSNEFTTPNSIGIIGGLIVGKLIGIVLASFFSVRIGIAFLPKGLSWRHILGVSLLGGIGFTMSIFIANLAFSDPQTVVSSKISILTASFFAAFAGLIVLRRTVRL